MISSDILGIDFSLSSPAYTLVSATKVSCVVYTNIKRQREFYNPPNFYLTIYPIKQNFTSIYDRMLYFANITSEQIQSVESIYLEDYSFSSVGKVFTIAEITGFVKYQCWLAGKPPKLLSPTAIKKFATGKGNANKELMIDAFQQQTAIDLYEILGINKHRKNKSPISDIVDSFHIAHLGKTLQ